MNGNVSHTTEATGHRAFAAPVAALVLLIATIVPVTLWGTTAGAAPLPSFYDVPDPLPAGGPGTVIKTEPVDVEGLHGTLQRVMYKSVSIQGEDIAVTGLIATPDTPAPAGGYKVIDWAHGTTGMADACAPSLDPTGAMNLVNVFLDKGWAVVASDFEGLGTPGLHPYIVGDSEARGVIDIMRAARNDNPDISPDYLVWGHSQGGHAAMFALHDADDWAPELNLVGVVAGAPPSQLDLVYDFLVNSPYKYYLLMVAGAINAAYGDAAAPLDEVLNPEGMAKIPLLDEGCTGFLAAQTDGLDVESLMVQQADGTYNPFSNPVWGPLIAAQDPQNFDTPARQPLLIIHGGADEQIPAVSSQMLAGKLCATGQDLERWMYPGQSHAGVIGPSTSSMVNWMEDRFAGEPAPATWAPTGQDDIDDTVCVDGEMVPRAAAFPDDGGTGGPVPPGEGADPEPQPLNGVPGPDVSGSTPPAATPVSRQPAYTG